MLQVSEEIDNNYYLLLKDRNIPKSAYADFRKWLRYYLDFCKKYNHSESENESLPLFIKKLQEKHQSSNQQKQASFAVTLYYSSLIRPDSKNRLSDFNERLPDKDKPAIKQSLPPGSVQNYIPKEHVNTLDSKGRKNLVSHSANYSDGTVNCNALADSVNENIHAYNRRRA